MKKLRIGIPLIQQELNGNTGWVAGLYFIKNSINALATLPEAEVPEVYAFLPNNFDEPLFNGKTAPSWLTLVRIPAEDLNNPACKNSIEQLIDQYACDVFFPLISWPIFHFKGKVLGWITDFQEKHLPQFFSTEEINFRKLLSDFLMSYSEKSLCISQDVLKDLKNHYPEYTEKGRVIYFRSILPETSFTYDHTDTLKKFNINEKYIYLPNQFWIHKNHKLVFEAWKKLKDSGLNYLLVCTGFKKDYRHANYYEELEKFIHENGLTDQIRLLGFVTRHDQIQIYRGASALLQPSLFEGWNTSLEDAKALGKKIIVSSIPIHHEQCGDDAVYFDPHNAEDLANTIRTLWDTLPSSIDLTYEKQARDRYQPLIQQFARDLIALFTEIHTETHCYPCDKYYLLGLPLLYHNFFRQREKDCADRLEVINNQQKELEKRLNLINKLDEYIKGTHDKSLVRKIFYKIYHWANR